MSKSVAGLVNTAMARKRRPDGRPWGPYQLMGAIGLLEGDRPFNITQVQRLLSGERRTVTDALVQRLLEVLPFTEEERDEMWKAAGLWPPDLDLEGYRRYRQLAATTSRELSPGTVPLIALPSDLDDELVRRLRPDRRHHDRRHPQPAPVQPGATPGQHRPRRLEVVAA